MSHMPTAAEQVSLTAAMAEGHVQMMMTVFADGDVMLCGTLDRSTMVEALRSVANDLERDECRHLGQVQVQRIVVT